MVEAIPLTRAIWAGEKANYILLLIIQSCMPKFFKEEKRTRGREAKILEWEYMFEANEFDKNFSDQVVIPRKCLYSQKNSQNIQTFLGYLMEKQTSFKVLKDVYVENDLSYAQKVWAARNLCILTNRVQLGAAGNNNRRLQCR